MNTNPFTVKNCLYKNPQYKIINNMKTNDHDLFWRIKWHLQVKMHSLGRLNLNFLMSNKTGEYEQISSPYIRHVAALFREEITTYRTEGGTVRNCWKLVDRKGRFNAPFYANWFNEMPKFTDNMMGILSISKLTCDMCKS